MIDRKDSMISLSNTELGALIGHVDIVSAIVLIVLVAMSIGCWAIFLHKWIQLRRVSKENRVLLAHLSSSSDINEVLLRSGPINNYGGLYICSSLFIHVERVQQRNVGHYISLQDWEAIRVLEDQYIEEVLHNMESSLSFISTSASVAPLLGLFGTVWGLVNAFMGIGKLQSSDMASVAPGIAQALITTLGGLLVAIPALLMYNYLMTRIRHIDQQLSKIAHLCSVHVQNAFVR